MSPTLSSSPSSVPPSNHDVPAISLPSLSAPQLSGSSTSAPNFDISSLPKIGKIGVCAMDSKARSKPCKHILNKLIEHGEFETVIFGDKVILDESIDYVELRKPYVVNDLEIQKGLWDRRIVLRLLQANGVPTPERIVISRDGGPRVEEKLREKLKSHGVNVSYEPELKFEMVDQDTLRLEDGTSITKPFVEKPVDGEDHNVYVYYHSSAGGGGRRLFRKVGNKSSEYDPDLVTPRTNGSYIYEKFMDTDNFEDVKAYTVGKHYCHAETRKSPVVDGIVRRNTYGKEIRFVTKLTEEEVKIASKISEVFEQTICGFDLLRVNGKSYVIDVNGFSFVKDNKDYYDNCARILRQLFLQAKKDRSKRNKESLTVASTEEKQQKWMLKGQVCVIRHADRTPKQKFKFSFKSQLFIDLLRGHKEEVIIREKVDLNTVLQTTCLAQANKVEDPEKLAVLRLALEKKKDFPGTKVQLKPVLHTEEDGSITVEKVQLIIKWGGEPTHSARYQALDLGDQMRQEALLLNKNLLKNIQIYTSSERRVVASAKIWASAYLDYKDIPEESLIVRKDLLDDSNAAKDLMDKVKKKLKPLLRKGLEPPSQFTWPSKLPEPFIVLSRVVELMNYHRKILEYNYAHKDVSKFQSRWCCNEDPVLFRERWDKLFKEFVTVEKVDPSKISELYDTMKYDGLHNRQFLENIFLPDPEISDIEPPKQPIPSFKSPHALFKSHFNGSGSPTSSVGSSNNNMSVSPTPEPAPGTSSTSTLGSTPSQPHHTRTKSGGVFDAPEYANLRELYRLSKILFDFICPQEYGIEASEKLDIGLLTSLPLVKQILSNIEDMKKIEPGGAASVFYFTKESHIYTLLNVIYESQIPTKIARNNLPELDYLTQLSFELYETEDKKHSIRLSISPGCNTQNPLDVQLDSKHCISCIPRIALTRHLDMDLVTSCFKSRFTRISMPKKFIPVNLRSSDSSEKLAAQVDAAAAKSIRNASVAAPVATTTE
ncbi:hypothetical protein DV451_003695 [Geotrichum candidum]|uniref:Inositol hexakisphosphate and diphosphoinositol-pentakisphosphate kinase n=1 Tax=Geotrichum candidum TaxID=1173061 RepID=A0A9P5G3V8_GEOCN|nr:hypothetical protein DV451_003695 [Geotrichum candidum]KAF5107516.1 hypothetical protein DV453_003046 [Geotrichum candidum]